MTMMKLADRDIVQGVRKKRITPDDGTTAAYTTTGQTQPSATYSASGSAQTSPRYDSHDVLHSLEPTAGAATGAYLSQRDAPKTDTGNFAHSSGSFAPAEEKFGALRRATNKAYRTANAFLPQESGVYIHTPDAYDTYGKLYDVAAEREARLHAMGGRSARELPQTLRENVGAGVLGGARGIVNAAGYVAQRGAEAQMEENAALWRQAGRNDYAQEMEKASSVIAPDGYGSWARFGEKAMQTAAEHAAGHGKAGRVLSDVARSVGGMAPAMAANMIVPGSGLPVMFTQAMGNATEEALRSGASKENALLYGTAVGAVEALTEKLTGGIPALGVGALDDAAETAIQRTLKSPAAQRAAIRLAKNLGEGAEEFVSEFADAYIYKQLVDSRDRCWKQVNRDAWYSALIGALTSAALSAPAQAGRQLSPKRLADETFRRVEAAEKESYYNHDSLKTLDASHHKKYTDTPVEAIVEPLLPSAVYLQHKLDYTWNGEKCFIPQFTEFTNVVTIAGYEQKNPIRDVERLVNAYHRPAQDWKKQAGSVTSDQYEFDLHWYEAKDGIQHEVKLKNRKERRI